MKVCKHCGVSKPLTEFYPRNNGCKVCCNLRASEWNKNNPDKVKDIRRKNKLKQKYGITVDEYDKMFEEQNGVCYLCGNTHDRRHLNVDHCHTTGKIRKLLCDKCNMALGLVNDSKELLTKMIGYLS